MFAYPLASSTCSEDTSEDVFAFKVLAVAVFSELNQKGKNLRMGVVDFFLFKKLW